MLHEPVARLSARGWIWLHLGDVDDALAHAQQAGSNPIAAMPSLHIAFASLVALFIGYRLRSAWRWLLVLYPCAMGFTLVYAGEHYVVDLVAGAAYAVGTHYVCTWWERRRDGADPGLGEIGEPTLAGSAGAGLPSVAAR